MKGAESNAWVGPESQQSWRHLQALLQPHSQLWPLPNSHLGVQPPLGPHLNHTPSSLAFPLRSPAPGLMGGLGLAALRGGSAPHISTTCGISHGTNEEMEAHPPCSEHLPSAGSDGSSPSTPAGCKRWATQETRGAPSKGPPRLGLGVGGTHQTSDLSGQSLKVQASGLCHWPAGSETEARTRSLTLYKTPTGRTNRSGH